MGFLKQLLGSPQPDRIRRLNEAVNLPAGLKIALQRDIVGDRRPRDDEDDGELAPRDPFARRQLLTQLLTIDMDRARRLTMYDEMDKSDIASSAVDMIAEDSTIANPDKGVSIWVESNSPAIREACQECFENVEIENEIRAVARTIALYGEDFERVIYEPFFGVRALFYTHPIRVVRREDRYRVLIGFIQDQKIPSQQAGYGAPIVHEKPTTGKESGGLLPPWEFVHFRNRGRFREHPYGTSILHNAIRPWRQICVVAGTAVETPTGRIPIEQARPGTDVLCYDPTTRQVRRTWVDASFDTGNNDIVAIRTKTRELLVTPTHPMLVRRAGGAFVYVEAADLRSIDLGFRGRADELVLPFQETLYEPVESVEVAGTGRTYDLRVADPLHNFIIAGAVSHNCLAEDQALIYRLLRAPDRFAFFVDTGEQGEIDEWASLNRFRRRVKKLEFVDPLSGRYDQRFNPLTPMEDLFIPTREGAQTKIEKLFGSDNVNDVTDLIYYIRKFCAAVRVPPEFLGFPSLEGQAADVSLRSSLANQSIRYASVLKNIQRALRIGIQHMLEIHLRLKSAYDPDSDVYDFHNPKNHFRVMMVPPSNLDEMDRIDAENVRAALARTMQDMALQNPKYDLYNWTVYVLKTVFRLTEPELKKVLHKNGVPDEYKTRDGQLRPGEEKDALAVVRRVLPELARIVEGS